MHTINEHLMHFLLKSKGSTHILLADSWPKAQFTSKHPKQD